MIPATKKTIRIGGRPVRRVAAGLALAGMVLGANAAIGLAGDGRDTGGVPGAPTDAPAPAPDDSDDGRDGGGISAPLSISVDTPPAPTPTDNGRGGPDPSVGPLPIVAALSTTPADSGDIDTDSGEVPAPDATPSSPDAPAQVTVLADQDVPGAEHNAPAGNDAPANDQDG